MELNRQNFDPILVESLQILKNQNKFKAKVLYTLSCINNCLSQSGVMYESNVEYLSNHHKIFIEIASKYCDSPTLQPISGLFIKFQEIGVKELAGEFLDIVEQGQIQGVISDGLVLNLCHMLKMLRHEYSKTKSICMKLLQNCSAKLKQTQINLLLRTMADSFLVSKQQCNKLCRLPNIPAVPILSLLWSNCINSRNDTTGQSSTNCQLLQYQIINKYLQQEWQNQVMKYLGMTISLWNGTNQMGLSEQLFPEFIDQFYRNQIKPLWRGTGKVSIDQIQFILQHFANQYAHIQQNKLKQQISNVAEQLSKHRQHSQILTNISNLKQLTPAIQVKYIKILPIQFLTTPQSVLNKLTLTPTPVNAFKTIMKLNKKQFDFNEKKQKIGKIYLILLQIYLRNKQCQYLKPIEPIIQEKLASNQQYIRQLLTKNQQYCLFIPLTGQIVERSIQDKKKLIYGKVDQYLGSDKIGAELKFYLARSLIKLKNFHGVNNFIRYLDRVLERQNLPYEQLAFYAPTNDFSEEQLKWLTKHFEEDMYRILQKIFNKLVDRDFQPCKQIIFWLEKLQILEEWVPMNRWTLNPLDDPNFENERALDNSFKVFEAVINKCKHIPHQVIKKFFNILAKNWENFNHHHMFTIEKVSRSLFSNQDLPQNQLQEIVIYVKLLIDKTWKMPNPQLYKYSLQLMFKNALMEETQQITQTVLKCIYQQLEQIQENSLKTYEKVRAALFAQELLMWRFQYQDETIVKETAQNLLKMLNNHDSYDLVNSSDLELLVQNSLQIISTVGHTCNLLDLSLNKILRNYLKNKNIIQSAKQIIYSVKEVSPKAIEKYHLQKILPQILSILVVSSDQQLNKNYIEFLDAICYDEQSSYTTTLNNNIQLLLQIFRSQAIFVTEAYRPTLINFVLRSLGHASYSNSSVLQINEKWIQIIWLKYGFHGNIRECCRKLIEQFGNQQNASNIVEKQQPIKEISKQQQQFQKPNNTQPYQFQENLKKEISKTQIKEQTQQQSKQPEGAQQDKEQVPFKKSIYEKQYLKAEEKENKKQIRKDEVIEPCQKQINEQQEALQIIKEVAKKDQTQIVKEKQVQESSSIDTTQVAMASVIQEIIAVPQTQKKTQNDNQIGNDVQIVRSKIVNIKIDEKHSKKGRSIEGEEEKQNINNIKAHINFISSLADIQVTEDELRKLKDSLCDLTDVVSSHSHYCQKVVNLGIVSKCLVLHPQTQSAVLLEMLQLFEKIGENKQRNLIIFNDIKSIQLFKKILNYSLNSKKQLPSNQMIINIIQKCWGSSNDYYKEGLLNILLEMVKQNLSRQKILQLFSLTSLTPEIINEICNQGLIDVMEIAFKTDNQQLTNQNKAQICYSTRLIGKICVNQSIREKLFSINFHQMAFGKVQIFKQMNSLSNLAFLYANFVQEFEKVANWCVNEKIPEYFLKEMTKQEEETISPDLYKFLRFFSENGQKYIEYLFTIKYHLNLIEMLSAEKFKISPDGFQDFCKSLSHLFVPNHYQFFIEQQIVPLLLTKYKNNSTFYVIECIQQLVDQITQIEELNVLDKQGLYQVNQQLLVTIGRVFKTKIKDDMSYSYVLKMYLSLFKKFGKFNTSFLDDEFVSIVIRKGLFSINMEGKKKVLQFLMEFSQIDKIRYGDGACHKIFQSLFNCALTYDQLEFFNNFELVQLMYDKLPKQISQNEENGQEQQSVKNKIIVQISDEIQLKSLVLNKYIDLRNKLQSKQQSVENIKKQLDKSIETLQLFLRVEHNASYYFEKLRSNLLKINQGYPYCFESSVGLINQFMKFKSLNDGFTKESNMLLDYLQKMIEYLNAMPSLSNQLAQQFIKLLVNCSKNNIIQKNRLQNFINEKVKKSKIQNNQQINSLIQSYKSVRVNVQLTQRMKQIMKKGIKVKMYKIDGSNSTLILHFTPDLMEINCVLALGQPVKSKWRLPLSQIGSIQVYNNAAVYQHSNFWLSAGIFTKPPPMEHCLSLIGNERRHFDICFEGQSQLKQWKTYIELAKMKVTQSLNVLK